MPEGGISASQMPYHSKVIEEPQSKNLSDISFKNDVDQINSVLEQYLSKELISLAFNLQAPCPVYIKDGELYRTIYVSEARYTTLPPSLQGKQLFL